MRSNSLLIFDRDGTASFDLVGTKLARETIEHAIHEPDLLVAEEPLRRLDILVEVDPDRRAGTVDHLADGCAQERTDDRVEALKAPALCQHRLDEAVYFLAPDRRVSDDGGEQLRVRRLLEPVIAELSDDVGCRCARHLGLIKR